ncbi:MAG: hypothetical protein JO079_09970, partial [Frankiaceae bacterium]|nr:hypothetical protein [Frankiaceae bacterium]
LDESLGNGTIDELIDEIVVQSQVEFNLSEDEEAMIKSMDAALPVQDSLDE